MESLWPRVEPLLAQVTKPARYIGGELGARSPSTTTRRCRGCSSTPTPTRSACPTRGCRSSTRSSTSATTPWPSGPTPRGSTWRRPCDRPGCPCSPSRTTCRRRSFDVLAFNLSAELVYTNVLNLIDLAGVPVQAADRDARRPASWWPAGTAPSTPSRWPTSWTASSWGTARRRSGRCNAVIAAWQGRPGPRAGPSGPPDGSRCSGPWPSCPGSTCRPATRPTTSRGPTRPRRARRACPGWSGPLPGSPRPPSGWRSGPSPTWASGPTRNSSWCRSSRWSTTASTSSCSGAAPGGAGSARPG